MDKNKNKQKKNDSTFTDQIGHYFLFRYDELVAA